jgi:hypothetical protein
MPLRHKKGLNKGFCQQSRRDLILLIASDHRAPITPMKKNGKADADARAGAAGPCDRQTVQQEDARRHFQQQIEN